MSHHFESVEFGSYGPIKNKTLRLTPLHALIGPNDSGKSLALRGIAAAARTEMGDGSFAMKGATKAGLRFGALADIYAWTSGGLIVSSPPPAIVQRHWSGGVFMRLDPDEMREPFPLISDGDTLHFRNDRGAGLGVLLDAVLTRSRKAFDEISQRFGQLFPTFDEFSFWTSDQGRRIGVKLKSGERVPAELMSEGMLYYLAFLLLPHLQPTSLLLVEEPENGLHPARIADVMKVLRDVSKVTQVVLATHSPLVVNELQPEEVTLVTRTESEGTKFTPIRETENFEERFKTYALGELWLSYANGKDEAPLLKKTGSA